MKVLSLFVAISIILSFFSPLNAVSAEELSNGNNTVIFSKLANSFYVSNASNVHYEANNIVIYGNYADFDSEMLYTLIHDESKICIFYDTNLKDNKRNNHEILRNNAVIYYHKNGIPYVHSYLSNANDLDSLIVNVEDYVREKLSRLENNDTFLKGTDNLCSNMRTTNAESFELLYAGSFREDEPPYGYIDCDFVVRKNRTNDISSLYLVEADVSFTPGKVAKDLGNANYDKWYNSSGFIKVKAMPASNEVGINQVRYGGTPVFKDAYPVNNPGTVSISSSYSAGITLGYSTNLGFSNSGFSVGIGGSTGYDIVYSYSKAYTYPEPALSAQKDPADVEKYTWLYTYTDSKSETNHLQVGYIFEMNNRGHSLLEGDLALQFEYQMTVDKSRVLFNNPTTFSGFTFHNYY